MFYEVQMIMSAVLLQGLFRFGILSIRTKSDPVLERGWQRDGTEKPVVSGQVFFPLQNLPRFPPLRRDSTEEGRQLHGITFPTYYRH